MVITAWIAFIGLALVLLFRYLAADYLARSWLAVCVLYVGAKSKENDWNSTESLDKVRDYAAVWPIRLMVCYFWIWDFRRFIVNQDEMNNIVDYFLPVDQAKSNDKKP